MTALGAEAFLTVNCFGLGDQRSELKVPGSGEPLAESARLVFNEGLQPRQGVIPLPGYVIEIFPGILDRLRFKLEQAFPSDADITHDTCTLQNAEMFRHRLPRETRASRQTGNGLRFAIAELGEHR